nr:SURF1 family protein [Sphingomonas gellani]
MLATLTFLALGIWQAERRSWKLDLIARIDARIHAAPVAPPPPARWDAVNDRADAYRRIRLVGRFDHRKETLVQALTERGAGFWVLTPLLTDNGIYLVNRGFVPGDRRDPASRAQGQVQGRIAVTGLLRITEPVGAFLRHNDPAAGRWYSRDVGAIARFKSLEHVAPFFVDADATPNPGGLPIGGLTVVSLPNNHLVYMLTWFALAALSAFGAVQLLRREPAR